MSVRGFLQGLIDRFVGYDFFISYAHRDGKAYPRALADALSALGFRVFLDEREYAPGAELRAATRRRVRMSSYLVILARRDALDSRWVMQEARESVLAKKTPLVIDFDRHFERLPLDTPLKQVIGERIAVSETGAPDAPSEEALAAIARSFKLMRKEQLRLRLFGGAALVFAIIAGVAVWQAVLAIQRQAEAERQARRATANLLAIQSDRVADAAPITALTLAAAAVKVPLDAGEAPPAVAETALRQRLLESDGRSLTADWGGFRAVSAGERRLLTMDDDRRLHVFDLDDWTGRPVASIDAPPAIQYLNWRFSISDDGRWISAADSSASDRDAKLFVADLAGDHAWIPAADMDRGVERVLFDVASRWMAALADFGPVLVWSLDRPPPADPMVIDGEHWPDREVAAVFTRDGHLITSDRRRLLRWPLGETGFLGEPQILAEGTHLLLRPAVDRTGRWLATANEGENRSWSIWLWDLASPVPTRTVRRIPVDTRHKPVWAAFSDRHLAIDANRSAVLVALEDCADTAELAMAPPDAHSSGVRFLEFSPSGRWLFASTGEEEGARLWQIGSGDAAAAPRRLPVAERTVAARFEGDDDLIVSQFDAVRVFGLGWDDVDSGDKRADLRGHDAVVDRLILADRGRTLLTVDTRDNIQIMDFPPMTEPAEALARHPHDALFLAPDDRWLIGRSGFGLRAWTVGPTADAGRSVDLSLRGRLTAFALDAEGEYAALGGGRRDEGEVRLWNLKSDTRHDEGRALAGFDAPPRALAFAPEGGRLAVLTADGALWVWGHLDEPPGLQAENAVSMVWPKGSDEPLAFTDVGILSTGKDADATRVWGTDARVLGVSNDGRFIVTAGEHAAEGDAGGLRLWDREGRSGGALLDADSHGDAAAWFGPQGRWLATWRNPGGRLRLWDLKRADPAARSYALGAQFDARDHLVFSRDGGVLVAPNGLNVQVWRLGADGPREPLILQGAADEVTEVSVSADGSIVAVGDLDGALWLWRLDAGSEPPPNVPIGSHDDSAVRALAMDPAGRWLASSNASETLIWPLDLSELIKAACTRAPREVAASAWRRLLPGLPQVEVCRRSRVRGELRGAFAD